MEPPQVQRKLTTILSADVKGYSRLMAEDEAATVRTLTAHRETIFALIKKHRGRVVDSPGDNLLAEFGSVVEALQCAVEVQEEIKNRNAGLPEGRRMEFRIGINVGDVIVEGERLYGDGVNIAARLEGLAEGSGICVSGPVFDQVKKKLDLGYAFLGEQRVKNIPEPVRVYRVLMEPEAAGKVIGEAKKKADPWRRPALVLGAALFVVLAGAAAWLRPWERRLEPASLARMAFPLPEKPSVAVLPFANLSEDPKQDFLADGIAENIITALSQIPHMFVISRTSTFTYKGKAVKVQRVAEEMGVRYVLEGSVQRAGSRVRVHAQLIDALKGHHLWSERYDREVKDIFAVQDEITQKVVTALEVKLTQGEHARIIRRQTNNAEAYLLFLRGREAMQRVTPANNAEGRRLYQRALSLDPHFATVWAYLAWTHLLPARAGWSKDPAGDLARAEELVRRALSIDPSNSYAYYSLGQVFLERRQHDQAVAYTEKAVALEPNSALAALWLGLTLTYAGRPAEGVASAERAMRLSPYHHGLFLRLMGMAYRTAGRYEEAAATLERARAREPDPPFVYIFLAVTYAEMGRENDARAAVAELLRRFPKFSLKRAARALPFKDPAELERALASLRKAGLPDEPPLPLPDKPSIAVLPFSNLSGDAGQEYFSDGMTEDIITALAKFPGLFVIARNSTFRYKGKAVDIPQVGRELGVRYVLEGSVRRAGERVRVTAQLIDAATGAHKWAERYDRPLTDIFALQDEMSEKIVSTLVAQVRKADIERARRKGTKDLGAYDYYLRGRVLMRSRNKEATLQARQMFEKAIGIDPAYAEAYAELSNTYRFLALRGWEPKEALGQSLEFARTAIGLNGSLPSAYANLGMGLTRKGRHEEGIAAIEKAISLNPNDAASYATLAGAVTFAGKPTEAIRLVEKAMRLDPFYPPIWDFILGRAHFYLRQHEKALPPLKASADRAPKSWSFHAFLAATYAHLGRQGEARAEIAQVRRLWPDATVRKIGERGAIYKYKEFLEHYLEGLRKAGLPE